MERILPVRPASVWRTTTVAAIAGAFAVPALAATGFTLRGALSAVTAREWLLTASLLLLFIALVARVLRGRGAARRDRVVVSEVEDLRWWRNSIAPGPH